MIRKKRSTRSSQRRISAALLVFFGVLGVVFSSIARAFPPPPTPGDAILLIYTDDPFNVIMANNVKTALTSVTSLLPAAQRPTITDLVIPAGDTDGIADNITGDPNAYLAQFCQIWDIRFIPINGSSGLIAADTITNVGVNNDGLLFTNFLRQGGHIYLQAENEGFYSRNEGLIQFVANVTGVPMGYPTAAGSWSGTTVLNTAPTLFQTAFASITAPLAYATWPGLVALANKGNGTPLVYNATHTTAMFYDAAQLLPGNGRMMITFDSNMLKDMEVQWDKYIVNSYTTLSTCYNFTFTKSVSPALVCAGEKATFSLCYNNVGTRDIPAVSVWDTLPPCTIYSSQSSPAPVSTAGGLIRWDLGIVTIGTSACVQLVVDTTACP